MMIYIAVFYFCIEANCGFFQAKNYTINEQQCLQEIDEKLKECRSQGAKVEAICVDMEIDKTKNVNH